MKCDYCGKTSRHPWFLNFPGYCSECHCIRIRHSAVVAAAVFLIDFWFYGGFFSVTIILLWIILVRVPSILTAHLGGNYLLRKNRLKRLGLYSAGVCLVYGLMSLNHAHGRWQGDRVVAACESFRGRYGRYPDQLSELVPEFMTSVPKAQRFTIHSDFHYGVHEGKPVLFWVMIPPYGLRFYSFEKKEWI